MTYFDLVIPDVTNVRNNYFGNLHPFCTESRNSLISITSRDESGPVRGDYEKAKVITFKDIVADLERLPEKPIR